MATATFGPQGKTRAANSIGGTGDNPRILRMNTIVNTGGEDAIMSRNINWLTQPTYARSNNTLQPKVVAGDDEYRQALLFPIAGGRRFSNMTLHFANTGFPLALTFVLEGAENTSIGQYGAAKLVGAITINF